MTDLKDFMSALGGPVFFRAIWPEKQKGPPPEGLQASREFYGEWSQELENRLRNYNQHGYGIYYGVNDPGPGNPLKPDSCKILRAIYRDCDTSEEAVKLFDTDPHIHIVTSPSKSQSLWLTEDMPSAWSSRIHSYMTQNLDHDPSTSGSARLLRAPGFVNTKYPDGPRVSVVSRPEGPRLPRAIVQRKLGINADLKTVDGNVSTVLNNVQSGSSSGGASSHGVRSEARAARAVLSTDQVQEISLARTGYVRGEPLEEFCRVLAKLDPDCPRGEWLRVVYALHFCFDGSEEGKAIAEGWSRLASHRWSARDFNTIWRGASTTGGNLVTWSYLVIASNRSRDFPAMQARLPLIREIAAEAGLPDSVQVNRTRVPLPKNAQNANGTASPDPFSVENALALIDWHYPDLHEDTRSGGIYVDLQSTPLAQRHIDTLVREADLGCNCRLSERLIELAIRTRAEDRKQDNGHEYFKQLEEWDGIPRIETLLIKHMGAADTPYIRAISSLLFIAAVRRTLQPGTKFDLLPILEGKQGLGKSSLFRLLCPVDSWFTDSVSFTLDEKRFYPQITGKMFVEFPELNGLNKADMQKVKKLISQGADEYIGMYGRHMTTAKRTAVFIGTTNDAEYFRDQTGNRRFPVIPVTKSFDFEEVKAIRSQVWAEAYFLEALHGPLVLPDNVIEEMEGIQESRMEIHTEAKTVLDALDYLGYGFITNDTIYAVLGIPEEHRDRRLSGQVGYAFKEISQGLAKREWVKDQQRLGKEIKRGFFKKNLLDSHAPRTTYMIDFSPMDGLHHREEIEL